LCRGASAKPSRRIAERTPRMSCPMALASPGRYTRPHRPERFCGIKSQGLPQFLCGRAESGPASSCSANVRLLCLPELGFWPRRPTSATSPQ
jgi:hypothetical protein